jgi:hypothetical protein
MSTRHERQARQFVGACDWAARWTCRIEGVHVIRNRHANQRCQSCQQVGANANELGIEMIIDYMPTPYGRAWKLRSASMEEVQQADRERCTWWGLVTY